MVTVTNNTEIEDSNALQNATELRYKTEMLYKIMNDLHSNICKTQSKEIRTLSLNTTQALNELYSALVTQQNNILQHK